MKVIIITIIIIITINKYRIVSQWSKGIYSAWFLFALVLDLTLPDIQFRHLILLSWALHL